MTKADVESEGKMAGSEMIQYYSEVVPTEVEWLWYPYIPYGKVTILQGDPGDGKSTLALNIAALVTTAGTFPDGSKLRETASVIYQCTEDGNSDTVKPRLIKAGADCEKIAFIVDTEEKLTLEDDRIEKAIKKTGARLLILDPIQSFLQQDGEMQNASRMRSVLRNLGNIAEKHKCAVLLIGHLNKASGGKKLYRGLGSIDIAASARSILMVARDEMNPEIRYMFPVKSSLAPEGCAISYYMNPELGFQWIGRCTLKESLDLKASVDGTKQGKRDLAKDLLKILLCDGAVPTIEIMTKMQELGISDKTTRLAQKELAICAFRKKDKWFWKLKDTAEKENILE